VGLGLLLAFPIVALAQGVVPEMLPSGSAPMGGSGASGWISGMTSVPGLNWIQAGNIRIWPTLNVGYKKIALNFNLNIPPTQVLDSFVVFPQYVSLLDTYPLDAKIQSADLAVGAFRLDAQLTPVCGLFGSVSANIPRTVGIESSEGPGIGVIPTQAWRWTGSRFQWSEYEFGGWYNINQAVGLVAGIRFDRISVRFADPEPVPGYRFFTIIPPVIRSATFPDYSGDLNTFFTIPYIGCQVLGPYFKGSLLIGSASARLRLPLALSHAGPYITGPIFGALGRRDLSEQAEYTFKNAGLFLEAGLESTFPVRFVNCTLWVKGNWLRIRGDGDVKLAGQSSAFLSIFGLLFTLPEPFSASSSGTSTLNQYAFDLGLSGSISF
jgi:hypothetical protein